jgi:hypothetical protein
MATRETHRGGPALFRILSSLHPNPFYPLLAGSLIVGAVIHGGSTARPTFGNAPIGGPASCFISPLLPTRNCDIRPLSNSAPSAGLRLNQSGAWEWNVETGRLLSSRAASDSQLTWASPRVESATAQGPPTANTQACGGLLHARIQRRFSFSATSLAMWMSTCGL